MAAGSDWINNFTNGDPNNIAHTWFAIKVIKQKKEQAIPFFALLKNINIIF